MGDQFDFAEGINSIGCGVGLPQLSSLNGEKLGEAIQSCLEDSSITEAARDAGATLRAEDDVATSCVSWISGWSRSSRLGDGGRSTMSCSSAAKSRGMLRSRSL